MGACVCVPVLLKVLPAAASLYEIIQLEVSQVTNIAEVKPHAIFVTRLSSRAVYFIQMKQQCFIVFYTYRIRQNFRGGKLSRLESKRIVHGKTFAVAASLNNECL